MAESRPIFTAAVVLLGSSITRTRRQATRHYLLFRWSIARSQVTRHCVLRTLIEPVVFQVSRAVEKSPITLRVWSLMTVDSSDCAKPEEPVWFCLKVQSKREHLVASGLRKQFGIVCFAPRLRLRKLTRRGPVWFVEAMWGRHWHPLAFLLLWPIRPLICSIIPARSAQLTTIGKTGNRRKFRRRDWPRRIISTLRF